MSIDGKIETSVSLVRRFVGRAGLLLLHLAPLVVAVIVLLAASPWLDSFWSRIVAGGGALVLTVLVGETVREWRKRPSSRGMSRWGAAGRHALGSMALAGVVAIVLTPAGVLLIIGFPKLPHALRLALILIWFLWASAAVLRRKLRARGH